MDFEKLGTIFKTVFLLVCSNIFMTFAWYGHLKFKSKPLLYVILASWLIALFEYCLQVPANRLGSEILSASQLKVIQEILTFIVFGFFSTFYLNQKPTLYDLAAFFLITVGVALSLFQPIVK